MRDFFLANECKFCLEDRVIFLPKIQISVTFDVRLMIVFLAKITHFSNRLIYVRDTTSPWNQQRLYKVRKGQ